MTDLTPQQLDHLERTARRATPGPYGHSGHDKPAMALVGVDIGDTYAMTWADAHGQRVDKDQAKLNHAFLTAATPEAVLALVAVARRAAGPHAGAPEG